MMRTKEKAMLMELDEENEKKQMHLRILRQEQAKISQAVNEQLKQLEAERKARED